MGGGRSTVQRRPTCWWRSRTRAAGTTDEANVAGRAQGQDGDARPTPGSQGRRPPRRRWWVLTLLALTAVGVLAVASVALAFHRIYDGATIPSEDELVLPDPTVVLDRDGEVLQTLEPAAIRENVALEDLPDHVPAAVLAAEDRRFYEHRGFSVRGIARAAVANLRARQVVQGASTIHQQYVAMAVEDIDESYTGKFREVAIAARLDDEFSKDRVLEMYLNSVPFGRSAHGIQAAARTYFDVDAVDLDVEQAAILAGMIAAPSAFDPARNPEGASSRRDFALGGMVEIGALDQATAEEHQGSDLPPLREDPLVEFGPDGYVLDLVRDRLPELLEDRADVSTGLRVGTTLDPAAQRLAHETLVEEVGEAADSGAIVTIESATGAVRALLGGIDYETQQFNVAVDGRRQIGSSFKTFALAELVDRGYHPDESIVDAPEEYEVGEGDDTATIGNYSGHGHGEVSVRQAMIESINTAFVILSESLGHDAVVEMSQRLGVRQEIAPVPSSVLGTADLSVLEVTAAYATLSAEGVRHDPFVIERVEAHDGEVLFEHEPAGEEVLSPTAAAVVTDVLVDVVTSGTGTAAAISHPVAGKTGTTNDFRDAWFVGYTPELTTGVWVGNRDNEPMDGVSGGAVPAATFGAYMEALVEGSEPGSFPSPDTSGLEPFDDLDATQDEDELDRPPTRDPEPVPEPTEDDEAREDEDEDDEAREDEDEDDEAREDEDEDDGDGDGDDGNDDDGNDDDGNDDDGNDDDGEANGASGDEGNGNGDDGNGNDDGEANGASGGDDDRDETIGDSDGDEANGDTDDDRDGDDEDG
jgi:penicillin-binding protein 1A